jgi:hypothetical protein
MTQTIINLGTGGAVLNGQNGSTASADSNDALFLDWTGLNYVYLSGVNGNLLIVPDEAALGITGDVDIRVQMALDDWTPTAESVLVSKWGISGTRSFYMSVLTSGVLRIVWSTDGATNAGVKDSTVATGIADGTVKWVRVTLDVDNGASGNDVKFFTSDDGATWTQLGATVTTSGATSIFSGSAVLGIGAQSNATVSAAGKFYRAQVLNGIGGTTVLDVDTSAIASGAATTFTALTGQTVTISRSTSGRKSVAVVSPVWLFGVDDFIDVVSNDLLNFGASDSFTVMAIVRQWATPLSAGVYVSKRDVSASTSGWALRSATTTLAPQFNTFDTGARNTTGALFTAGTLQVLAGQVSEAAGTQSVWQNNVVATTSGAVGSLSNTKKLRIGAADAGAISPQEFEGIAFVVFRRLLTQAEIQSITAYYQARLS